MREQQEVAASQGDSLMAQAAEFQPLSSATVDGSSEAPPDMRIVNAAVIGVELTGQHCMSYPPDEDGLSGNPTRWTDTTATAATSLSYEEATEHGNKKLDMSLDELIAQSSQHPQQQELQSKTNHNRYYDSYRQQQPYHHQYKGRRGPSGEEGLNQAMRYRNLYQHHRNSPFPMLPACQQPPPPPPLHPYGNVASQLLLSFQAKELLGNPIPLQPNTANPGPQRNKLLDDFLRRPQQSMRKTRIYRALPYEPQPTLHPDTPTNLRNQIVAELLLQHQRARASLLLANGDSESARAQGRTENIRPVRKAFLDPVAMAEQAALNESELIYPVMVDANGQSVESPDDALIIRFKGTDVLKVRKARGDLILNSGGWKTLSTRLVLNKALKPLGIRIEEVPGEAPTTEQQASTDAAALRQKLLSTTLSSGSNEWRVVESNAVFLATFTDGMVVGSVGASTRRQLMARASVIAQNWKQVKSGLNVARKKVI